MTVGSDGHGPRKLTGVAAGELRDALNHALPSSDYNAAVLAALRWAIHSGAQPDGDLMDSWIVYVVREALGLNEWPLAYDYPDDVDRPIAHPLLKAILEPEET